MIKQIIIVRKDLKMGKGKLISQGSHASLGAILMLMDDTVSKSLGGETIITKKIKLYEGTALFEWIQRCFTKICLCVNSEEELFEIDMKLVEAGIKTKLIIDNGRTEFNGVPTVTCLATEPWDSEELDKITGHLKLL